MQSGAENNIKIALNNNARKATREDVGSTLNGCDQKQKKQKSGIKN